MFHRFTKKPFLSYGVSYHRDLIPFIIIGQLTTEFLIAKLRFKLKIDTNFDGSDLLVKTFQFFS
jgi:hypothetical protein